MRLSTPNGSCDAQGTSCSGRRPWSCADPARPARADDGYSCGGRLADHYLGCAADDVARGIEGVYVEVTAPSPMKSIVVSNPIFAAVASGERAPRGRSSIDPPGDHLCGAVPADPGGEMPGRRPPA